MKNTLLYLYLLSLLFLISCQKQIPVEDLLSHTGEVPELAVEGCVSSELNYKWVKLSRCYTLSSSSEPIKNAKVIVTDGQKEIEYSYSESLGVYISNIPYEGIVGEKYTLNITLDGKNYTASDELIPADDELNFPYFVSEDNYNNLEIYTHNAGFDKPNIWTIETSEYKSDTAKIENDMCFYTHKGAMLEGIFAANMTTTILSFSTDTSLLIIKKMSVSDAYYAYLWSLFNVADWGSGVFSKMPANTLTNLSEGATGFFYCTDVKTFKTTIRELNKSK